MDNKSIARRNWLFSGLMMGLFGVSILVAGCASSAPALESENSAVKVRFPPFIANASAQVQEAYSFALQHPEVTQYVPCYCGCVNEGHTSLTSCYIREIRKDGVVVFDSHNPGAPMSRDDFTAVMKDGLVVFDPHASG